MAEFGRTKLRFFKRFLKLKHGIPSHDTFSTGFRMLDPEALDAAFGQIIARLVAALAKGGVIAIDGKSLKGTYDKGKKSSPRMMVSAYASGLRLTLATVAAKNGNEVDAALDLIGLIDLEGGIATGDALHCNRRMVGAIVDKGGDDCITRKANQDSRLSDARACLSAVDQPKPGKTQPPTAETGTKAHGRIETRIGVVVAAKGLAKHHEFPGPKAFGRVEATREIDGKVTTDVRIFALSRKLPPEKLLESVRSHWQIRGVARDSLRIELRSGCFEPSRLTIVLGQEARFRQFLLHGGGADRMRHLRQRITALVHALRHPDLGPHGIAERRFLDQPPALRVLTSRAKAGQGGSNRVHLPIASS